MDRKTCNDGEMEKKTPQEAWCFTRGKRVVNRVSLYISRRYSTVEISTTTFIRAGYLYVMYWQLSPLPHPQYEYKFELF